MYQGIVVSLSLLKSVANLSQTDLLYRSVFKTVTCMLITYVYFVCQLYTLVLTAAMLRMDSHCAYMIMTD